MSSPSKPIQSRGMPPEGRLCLVSWCMQYRLVTSPYLVSPSPRQTSIAHGLTILYEALISRVAALRRTPDNPRNG